jgi:hypothetical protein
LQNTAEDARVMSWWDYGYQIAGMANRTTLGKQAFVFTFICVLRSFSLKMEILC